MKFEQALKAMRRGEKVRRKRWNLTCPRAVIWIGASGAITDNFNGGEKPGFTKDSELIADDWVIVRKKPKAPAPRYTEDQLEPVETVPVVGDRCVCVDLSACCRGLHDVPQTITAIVGGIAAFDGGAFQLAYFDRENRILKRPAKPLRNVFADPRVGDVVKFRCFPVETIRYVDADMVSTWDGRRATSWSRHEGSWGLAPDFTVISRAPEEVAPTA